MIFFSIFSSFLTSFLLLFAKGAPYPAQEENAIDCVMRFAIDHLGFPEEKIILHGWSIGGYTATWAAMNFPKIKSLVKFFISILLNVFHLNLKLCHFFNMLNDYLSQILDATFDDVLPLATTKMPPAIENVVRSTIRQYLNLNIAEQLNKYAFNI